jgi:FMN reductase
MSYILTVSASPSTASKSAGTRRRVEEQLRALGHEVGSIDVRDLPAAALLAADTSHPDIAAAVDHFERADGVVVVTPVFKASYSGLLKTLLDLLPQRGLADKVVLPLATGGSLAHLLDRDITRNEHGHASFAPETHELLSQAVERFERVLSLRSAFTAPLPAAAAA